MRQTRATRVHQASAPLAPRNALHRRCPTWRRPLGSGGTVPVRYPIQYLSLIVRILGHWLQWNGQRSTAYRRTSGSLIYLRPSPGDLAGRGLPRQRARHASDVCTCHATPAAARPELVAEEMRGWPWTPQSQRLLSPNAASQPTGGPGASCGCERRSGSHAVGYITYAIRVNLLSDHTTTHADNSAEYRPGRKSSHSPGRLGVPLCDL